MRKLLCKIFNKFNWVHQFKKTGANQYGVYGKCKFCGKKYYESKDFRYSYDDYKSDIYKIFSKIGKPINPTILRK